MKFKTIVELVSFAVILMCLAGCKDAQSSPDNSSDVSGTVSIPVVIADDKNDAQAAQSELDDILNAWEENNPTVNIEADVSDKEANSASSDNNSDRAESDTPSSEKEESEQGNSTDQNSSEVSSGENTDSSAPEKEDDGYFDVAV